MDNSNAQRYPTKEKASIEVYGRSGQAIVSVKDLSSTGACLEWQHESFEINQGDLIRMTVILRTLNRKHFVNAEVIWKQGKRSGVSFIPSNQVLDRLLERNT